MLSCKFPLTRPRQRAPRAILYHAIQRLTSYTSGPILVAKLARPWIPVGSEKLNFENVVDFADIPKEQASCD